MLFDRQALLASFLLFSSKSLAMNFLIPEVPIDFDPMVVRTPTQYILFDHLSGKLVNTARDGQIIGELAESWEILENFTLYKFKLGAYYWSDGSKITPHDVKNHFEKAISNKTTTHVDFSQIKSVNVSGDREVAFVLNKSSASFLDNLTRPESGIFKVENAVNGLKSVSVFNMRISSGPYRLKGVDRKNRIIELVANNFYRFSKINSPKKLNFVDLAENLGRKYLATSSFDFSWIPHGADASFFEMLAQNYKTLHRPMIAFSHFVTINSESSLFKDRDDRMRLLRSVSLTKKSLNLGENWEQANQLYLKDSVGRLTEEEIEGIVIKKNGERRILPKTTVRLCGLKSRPFLKEVARILGKLGYDVNLIVAENSEEFVRLMESKSRYDLCVTRVDMSGSDLKENLSVIFNPKRPYIIPSKGSKIFSDLENIEASPDINQRARFYKSIGESVLKEGLIIPLFHESMVFAYDAQRLNLSGLSMSYPDLRFWRTDYAERK